MGYEHKVRELKNQLSPNFLKLADFLLDSYADAAFMTATELAQHLGIDAATVVRFAQRLGYPGYPELQREVRQRLKHDLSTTVEASFPADSVEGIFQQAFAQAQNSLEATRRGLRAEGLRQFVEAVESADQVLILADGDSLPLAQSLENNLRAGAYPVRNVGANVTAMAQALARLGPTDLAVAVELVPSTPFVSRGLELARRRGARTAALVGAPSLETTRHADTIVAVHAASGPGIPAQVALAAFLVGLHQALAGRNAERFESLADGNRDSLAYFENK